MNLKLENRVYFVSGGSQGIGKEIVYSLLNEAASVITCARSEEALKNLRSSLSPVQQERLYTVKCDVQNSDEVSAVLSQALQIFGRLDGIVANAGHGVRGSVLETKEQDWLSQYSLKLFSILNLVKPAMEELKKSDSGRIVIINAVTANNPESSMAAVSAARAGVKQMAKLLAQDLAPDILVNTINIGVIDTHRQREKYLETDTLLDYALWAEAEATRRGIPLHRFGKPSEVAPFVLLLLSPLSSYVTGASIDISGGL